MSVFQNLILSTVLDLVLVLQIKKQTDIEKQDLGLHLLLVSGSCLVLNGKKQSHREEEEFWSPGVMDSNIGLVLVVGS